MARRGDRNEGKGPQMVNFDPDVFTCPVHPVDLTDQVRDRLDTTGDPVSYLRPGARKRFIVPVNCPGDGTEKSGHVQFCDGEYWR